jgi:hypothetical protein
VEAEGVLAVLAAAAAAGGDRRASMLRAIAAFGRRREAGGAACWPRRRTAGRAVACRAGGAGARPGLRRLPRRPTFGRPTTSGRAAAAGGAGGPAVNDPGTAERQLDSLARQADTVPPAEMALLRRLDGRRPRPGGDCRLPGDC